jgi:hypothetical protein
MLPSNIDCSHRVRMDHAPRPAAFWSMDTTSERKRGRRKSAVVFTERAQEGNSDADPEASSGQHLLLNRRKLLPLLPRAGW